MKKINKNKIKKNKQEKNKINDELSARHLCFENLNRTFQKKN